MACLSWLQNLGFAGSPAPEVPYPTAVILTNERLRRAAAVQARFHVLAMTAEGMKPGGITSERWRVPTTASERLRRAGAIEERFITSDIFP